ncbi:electron transport complex subunit RsxG, partial [Vibrio campbellii]
MLNAIKNNALILVIFACASTGLVAVTNLATKDTIAE